MIDTKALRKNWNLDQSYTYSYCDRTFGRLIFSQTLTSSKYNSVNSLLTCLIVSVCFIMKGNYEKKYPFTVFTRYSTLYSNPHKK